ncbi:MAG TPA: hypothetical protein VM529_01340 [Gemmata sp.]|nr:hypothetical protein [Gemmata sp.]
MGLLDGARAWLAEKCRAASGSVTVTYARGAESVTVAATPGRVAMLSRGDSRDTPVRTELSERDYLIAVADLAALTPDFGVPHEHDTVTETVNGEELVFEVRRPDNGERCWRYWDIGRTEYRIHCKRVR